LSIRIDMAYSAAMVSHSPDAPDMVPLPGDRDGPAAAPDTPQAIVLKWGFVTAMLGWTSAAVIGWGTGWWMLALLFGALVSVAAVAALLWMQRQARTAPQSDALLPLRALLEALPDAAALTDSHGALLQANEKYGALLTGFAAPLGLAGADAERNTARTALDDAARGGTGAALVKSPAGTTLRLSCQLLEGVPAQFLWRVMANEVAALQDVTVAALAGAMGKNIAALDVALLAVDPGGRILAANAALADMAGTPADSLIGAPLSGWMRHVQGQLFFGPEGQAQRLVEARDAPLTTDGGVIAGHLIDIRLLQAAPQKNAPALGADTPPAYLENLPLPLALADRDGRILFANAAFRETTGEAALLQDRVAYPSDLVADEDRAVVSDLVRRVGAGATGKQRAMVRLRRGAEEPVQLSITPTQGMGPRVGGVAAVLTLADNAERRKLEEQFAQAQKMNLVGQLAGGIAHDFNNILTAIGGFCELLLQRHPPGDSSFADINQILTNANRAASLVKQLLAYSRQQTLKPTTVQITDLITEQVVTLKRLIGDRMKLDVQHGRDLPTVRVDQGQFYTVVMNLVVNARDAMPQGGTISIRTFEVKPATLPKERADVMEKRDYIAVEVRDTGSGIAADVLPKIFEPFFTTKAIGQGTGLGLSTVYGIVKQSNGFIFADSLIGVGTAFTIYLPAYADAVAEIVAAPVPLQDLWGKATILLVEDEDAVRAFATKALERKGYTVLSAASGEEALELLERDVAAVNILVTDVVMPNMDGPALALKVRAARPDLPVLFMSGYAEEQLRQSLSSAFDMAHVAFLPKPFSLKDLAQTVKDVLGSQTSA
jgi:two-component system, cell cycle sensor histidine kinase and response regulator CckA